MPATQFVTAQTVNYAVPSNDGWRRQ